MYGKHLFENKKEKQDGLRGEQSETSILAS